MTSKANLPISVFALEGLQCIRELHANSALNAFHNPIIAQINAELEGINTFNEKIRDIVKGVDTLAEIVKITLGERPKETDGKNVSELRKRLRALWDEYDSSSNAEILLEIKKVVLEHYQSLRYQFFNVKKWANVIYQLVIAELFSAQRIITPYPPKLNLKIVSGDSIDEDGTGSVYYLEKHLSVKHSYSIISNGSTNQKSSTRENQRGHY